MNITDNQIDAFFRPGRFCARDCYGESRNHGDYEVVEELGHDLDVITDSQKHHGYFDDWDEAKAVARRLHVRWVLSQDYLDQSIF